MDVDDGLAPAAQLFKVLGNPSRLRLMRLLEHAPTTVGELASRADLSQPLVSQHLRTLRDAGLVIAERHGKEVTYQVADEHVAHVIADAVAHVLEPAGAAGPSASTPESTSRKA
ncbi:ArsR/SmtB family transcription factor [Brachybacterium sp. AOP25-B2-12]|uniref:ArsR/SmtB family transcription factor n=1 Tax=Brachybacterium sp. AOP25-B2-12 TaxID=3457710 RepID=UPI0040336C22